MGLLPTWLGGSPTPPAKPAATKPAAPPTTQNASATKPTQECPTHSKHPCDVDKLMIEVSAKGTTKPLKLKTTKVRRLDKVTDVEDPEIVTLLKTYDLVIECLADPKPTNEAKPAKITGRAYYTSPKCETQSHSLLTLKHLATTEIVPIKRVGATEIDMPEHPFFAPTSWIDTATNGKGPLDNLAGVIEILITIFEALRGQATDVDLIADTCGRRAAGAGGNLNELLLARVRVYRDAHWTVGVKIPAFASTKFEKKRAVNGEKEQEETRETTSGFGATKDKSVVTTTADTTTNASDRQSGGQRRTSSTSITRDEDGHLVSDSRSVRRSDGDGYDRKYAKGAVTFAKIDERLSADRGFDLVIALDSYEIELGEAWKKLVEAVKAFWEAITNIRKFFKLVPKVGWTFNFYDASFLAGKILVECSPEYEPEVKANERFYAVSPSYHVKIEVTLVSVKLGIEFGVELHALGSSLVAALKGEATISCSIKPDFTVSRSKPNFVLPFGADGKVELSGEGNVDFLGKTLANAKLSVSTGIEFKGNVDVHHKPWSFEVSGTLSTKKTLLEGNIRSERLIDRKIDPPYELLPEHEIASFPAKTAKAKAKAKGKK
jgi:hypothetical protein